jgi:hypothetical protein
MRDEQSDNETGLLKKQVPGNIRHANEKSSGQRETKCQFTEAGRLFRIEGVLLACNVAKDKHEEYGDQSRN